MSLHGQDTRLYVLMTGILRERVAGCSFGRLNVVSLLVSLTTSSNWQSDFDPNMRFGSIFNRYCRGRAGQTRLAKSRRPLFATDATCNMTSDVRTRAPWACGSTGMGATGSEGSLAQAERFCGCSQLAGSAQSAERRKLCNADAVPPAVRSTEAVLTGELAANFDIRFPCSMELAREGTSAGTVH